jgi:DNA-binding NarL/FixJ family response regulator
MLNDRQSPPNAPLRVLLMGSISGARLTLAGWLGQQEGVTIAGPVPTVIGAATQARFFEPHAIILDIDGWRTSISSSIAQLRSLTPATPLIVLSCHAGDALRHYCHAAGADAVFAKTHELDHLAAKLATLPRTPRAAQSAFSAP